MSASQQSWRFEQKLEAARRRRRCIGRQRNELALRAILRTKVGILDEAVAQPPGFRQQLAHGQFLDLLDVLLFSSDEQTGAREPKSPLSTRIPSVHQGLSAKMTNLVHVQPTLSYIMHLRRGFGACRFAVAKTAGRFGKHFARRHHSHGDSLPFRGASSQSPRPLPSDELASDSDSCGSSSGCGSSPSGGGCGEGVAIAGYNAGVDTDINDC